MDFITESFIRETVASRCKQKVEIVSFCVKKNILPPGENYFSQVQRVEVVYNQMNESRCVSLIVKIPFEAPMYPYLKKFDIYRKERVMYSEILPEMRRLLGESLAPENYHSPVEDVLVLQDLGHGDFRMANRLQQLDLQHCFLALAALAKFHACSIKLNETRPDLMAKVKEDKFAIADGWEESKMNRRLQQLACIGIRATGNPEFGKKLATFQPRKMAARWLQPHPTFSALNHGDAWTNNILFRYAGDAVAEAKMVDWQLCRWASPASDFIYFAINSVQFEVFTTNFNLLLGHYHDTLRTTMETLGCKYSPYSSMEFRKDVMQAFAYGVVVMIKILPIVLNDPNHPIDLLSKEVDFMDHCYEGKLYKDVLSKWLVYYNEHALL